jgi:hypothetical protein
MTERWAKLMLVAGVTLATSGCLTTSSSSMPGAATQFGQLRRLGQFGRVFVTVGRQQWWRWRARPRLELGLRVEFQLSQPVGPARWQCGDNRRCLRQCRFDWLPGAGLPGRTVARFGRFCATSAAGLAVAAGAG